MNFLNHLIFYLWNFKFCNLVARRKGIRFILPILNPKLSWFRSKLKAPISNSVIRVPHLNRVMVTYLNVIVITLILRDPRFDKNLRTGCRNVFSYEQNFIPECQIWHRLSSRAIPPSLYFPTCAFVVAILLPASLFPTIQFERSASQIMIHDTGKKGTQRTHKGVFSSPWLAGVCRSRVSFAKSVTKYDEP